LQPVRVRTKRGDDRLDRRGELRAARGREPSAARALEHLRDGAREEVYRARDLPRGRLGVNARRVLKVGASLRKQTRRLTRAREQRVEPPLDGRVVALQDVVERRGDEPAVESGIALPRSHVFEFEQACARVRREPEEVVARFRREPRLVDARERGDRRAQTFHLGRD
jgi:hypothetical protein